MAYLDNRTMNDGNTARRSLAYKSYFRIDFLLIGNASAVVRGEMGYYNHNILSVSGSYGKTWA